MSGALHKGGIPLNQPRDSRYEDWRPVLEKVRDQLVRHIQAYNRKEMETYGENAYEHLLYRIKGTASMKEKCRRKGLPFNARSALHAIRDAIGLRIVCRFLSDIDRNLRLLRAIPGCTVIQEKDYVRNVKPNGYRSYHLILRLEEPFPDVEGNDPGIFYAEVQLRTIAMDSWASLEHELKYKRNIRNPELIGQELKRCADELAACDLSMETIRKLIRESGTVDPGKESGTREDFTCRR